MTGQLWVADVGQGAREEVDTPIVQRRQLRLARLRRLRMHQQRPGACATPRITHFPIFDYAHASGRCSITGGYVYRGSSGALPAGTYVYGDYCSGEIFSWDGSTQTVLLDTTLNISSFGEDEQGELYVVNLGGTLSKIVPTVSCTYSVSPSSAAFQQAGGTASIVVTVGAGCTWTAVSNDSWITVTGGAAGSGNGTVTYSVAPYTGRPRNRNGTMTIAGKTVSVKQSR